MNRSKGYIQNFDEVDDEVSVAKGQAVAGCSIGILVLDLWYPYIPGNVANASTFSFPVRFKVLKETTIPQIMSHDPSLLDSVIKGGKELERDGVRAIVGACGYFGYYQREAAAALNVPVFLSSLLQIPVIKNALRPDQKVGVMCAEFEALSPETLGACGADPSDIVVYGAQDLTEFQNILKCTGHYNPVKMRDQLVGLSKKLVSENPDVGAILLECSDMPPFAWSIHNATGLPVFDFITMINWIHSAVVRRPFGGFM